MLRPQDIIAKDNYDVEAKFTFSDSFDISNITFYSKVKDKTDGTEIADFTVTKDGQEITLSLAKATVTAIAYGAYYYDVKGVDAGGNHIYYWEGIFKKEFGATDTP